MNIFEAELQRMQKRLKRLDESMDKDRDSRKLKSNKMLYELDVEARKAQLEAYHARKPFSDMRGFIAQSMGFVPAIGINAIPTIPQDNAMKYFDEIRSGGLVGDACDMSIIGGSLKKFNDGPDDAIALCSQRPCTVQYLASLYRSFMDTTGRPTYYMDISFQESWENLVHVADQLGEWIEIAEKNVPGVKFDVDRLIELQAYAEEARGYYKEIYTMLRTKPCPLGGRDAFWQTSPIVPGLYPNPAQAIEYAKARRDEVAERVDKGIAAVPGEKLRVLWTVTRPFFMDNFQVVEKWGIVIPLFYSGPTNFSVPLPLPGFMQGRKLTPLQKEAWEFVSPLWSGTGRKWIDPMIWICRDLKIDAIINYNQRGATCTLGLKKLVEDAAEKELGIPTLQLEGAQWDTNYASEKVLTSKLDEFAEMLLSQQELVA